MHPNAPDFDEKLAQFQQKLLSRYSDFFKHVKNGELHNHLVKNYFTDHLDHLFLDFIRMLMIIRQKCPSRGAKRTRDADPAKENILKGIVEWINVRAALLKLISAIELCYIYSHLIAA